MTRQGGASGLVLGELVLSIFIAGVVAMTVASQLRGSITVTAQAQALYTTTQKMAANWSQFAATCGAHSDVSPSSLLAVPSATAVDVLTKGDTAVNPSFVNCYHQSHLQLLTDAIRYSGNTPQVQQYNLTFSGGGTAPFVAQFTAVPTELAYALATRYGGLQATSLKPSEYTGIVRYWPDQQGGPNTYVVQILVGAPASLATVPVSTSGTSGAGLTSTQTTSGGASPPASPGGTPPSPATLTPPTSITLASLSPGGGTASGGGGSSSNGGGTTSGGGGTTSGGGGTTSGGGGTTSGGGGTTSGGGGTAPGGPTYTFNSADICMVFPGGSFSVGQSMTVPSALYQAVMNGDNSALISILGPALTVKSQQKYDGNTGSISMAYVDPSTFTTYTWNVKYDSQATGGTNWSYSCAAVVGSNDYSVSWNADQNGNFTSYVADTVSTGGGVQASILRINFVTGTSVYVIGSVTRTGDVSFFISG